MQDKLKDNLTGRVTYELKPRYDARKSFYHKAFLTEEFYRNKGCCEDIIITKLRSYSTIVAEIKPFEFLSDGTPLYKAYVYSWDSQTTGRHIKEFLKQHGFRANNKAQILRDYGVEEE